MEKHCPKCNHKISIGQIAVQKQKYFNGKLSIESLKFHFGRYEYWYDSSKQLHHVREYTEPLQDKIQPPVFLQVAITNYCNLNCKYCYASSSPKGKLIWTLGEMTKILSDFANAGMTAIAFGGGEPLTVPWFVELLEYLHRETDLSLSVTTNGVLLTQELVEILERIGVEVRISINSLDEYRTRSNALELLEKSEVQYGINSILSKENEFLFSDEIEVKLKENERVDLLLLKSQSLGRGGLEPMTDNEMRSVIQKYGALLFPRPIKFSSGITYPTNGVELFPPAITSFPGFFGSLDYKKRLKHTSFCPDICSVEINGDPFNSWQKVLQKTCIRNSSLL